MTPPYESLLLCAEQAPLSMALYLQLWRHCTTEGTEYVQFERDESEDWHHLLASLRELEAWELINLQFLSHDEIEVTLPIRNGQKLPYLDN